MSKNRTKENGSNNDNWATPDYILNWVKKNWGDYFDPCPLNHDLNEWNGLEIDWQPVNFINPPYNITDKPKFVKKCYEEYLKGNKVILLIPSTTETKWFHELIVPFAKVYLLKSRVKFKGTNSKGIYVTNKTGQSGSMICVFDKELKTIIEAYDFHTSSSTKEKQK